MRILVAIPHYFRPVDEQSARHGSQRQTPQRRIQTVRRTLLAIHQSLGQAQCMMQLAQRRAEPANQSLTSEVHVVVCTTGPNHLLDHLKLDPTLLTHAQTRSEPELLGYECHGVLRDRWGNYDYYCYMEDDLVIHDPWFLRKLQWFHQHVGKDSVLLPNRFEVSDRPIAHRAYVDGDLRPEVTAGFQNVQEEAELKSTVMGQPLRFVRALNPHSGCFFLTSEQMQTWMNRPDFLDQSREFVGPLESAATLGVMRTFRIYKPARENASFLEIEHDGTSFISQLRRAQDGAAGQSLS